MAKITNKQKLKANVIWNIMIEEGFVPSQKLAEEAIGIFEQLEDYEKCAVLLDELKRIKNIQRE